MQFVQSNYVTFVKPKSSSGPDGMPEDEVVMSHKDEMKEKEVRQFRIEKADLTKYGYTKQCAGCVKVANRGMEGFRGHRGHTTQCRMRIRKRLEEDGDQRMERETKRVATSIEAEMENRESKNEEEGQNKRGRRKEEGVKAFRKIAKR